MEWRSQLLALGSAYCEATGLSESRVATIFASQGTYFDGIRAGKECTIGRYLKMKRAFSDAWPENTPWPEGVDRPSVLPTAPAKGEAA